MTKYTHENGEVSTVVANPDGTVTVTSPYEGNYSGNISPEQAEEEIINAGIKYGNKVVKKE
ncbi:MULTISPECIES: hypothetical protein [Vibrio]|uniref:hypothetical protein n=1 Tax=Vibrio TaxID=662 RepID=UPI00148BF3BC|nr:MULTISPECIES: hypothetical protein [Vibrio]NOI16490.1 hypothetical protein [Vibrio hepatarius]